MIDDKNIKKALKEVYEERNTFNADKENENTWNFTVEYDFENKMDKLRKSRDRKHWKNIKTSRRIVIALIAILVLLSSVMSAYAFKKPIVDFIIKKYEEYSSYRVDKDTVQFSTETINDSIVQEYIPTNIPNNFLQSDSYNDGYSLFILWNDSDGNSIEFYQEVISTQANLNTENTDLKQITIEDKNYYTYTKESMTSYLWYQYGYYFILNVPESFSIQEVSIIINSIQLNNN